MPNKNRNGKRILSVTIKRMLDDSPDTSYLGEYSDKPTSEFSIDRMHSEDCASLEHLHRETVDKLERIQSHIQDWKDTLLNENCDCASRSWYGMGHDSACPLSATDEEDTLDEAISILCDLQSDAQECDCGGHCASSREYRLFNPSFNYVTKEDKPADGLTPEEVRKYTRQDYDRMESLNNGNWCYIGIRAEAQIAIPDGGHNARVHTAITQNITSGGLWGIESDSDREYLESVGKDELADLKGQLKALGFSSRAISQAFKSVEEVSE